MVRTAGFHPVNRSSILRSATISFQETHIRKSVGFYFLKMLFIPIDHSYQKEDNSNNKKDMDKTTNGIGSDNTEYPEYDEDDGNSFKHRKK